MHFQIYFNPNDLKYYIQDLGFSFGPFMKLTFEMKINDNCLINIGNSYLVFTFGNDQSGEDHPNKSSSSKPIDKTLDKALNIKLFTENIQYDLIEFYPNLNTVIYLGSDTECDELIDDSLLSRFHCTVEYKKHRGWFITDGKTKGKEIK